MWICFVEDDEIWCYGCVRSGVIHKSDGSRRDDSYIQRSDFGEFETGKRKV